MKNDLIVHKSFDPIKKQCLTCYEIAHEKPFDFEDSWKKTKHPYPKGNNN